ncbi:MAG: lipid-A-disaccharide synthase [Neomegalonema sp.]|nr:lipid-A-disaccharide synthase [Neomegalonema sp.]
MKIFMLAGESSGDRLGAALMRSLRAEYDGEIQFCGVGGAGMLDQGLESLFPIRDIAVMGLTEVAARLPTILRRMKTAREAVIAARPDALITIDAPAFGLRVAKQVKPLLGAETALIHYVAPTVWAWRPKRAEKLAKIADHLLALLPFEPPYFERVGLSCEFVGHPITEREATPDAAADAFRAEIDAPRSAPLIVALPGSRRSEVQRLAPIFGEALALAAGAQPDLRVVLPAGENVVEDVQALTASWPVRPVILDPRGRSFEEAEKRKRVAMRAADAALAASGTVSLELAAAATPMVIAYKVSTLSAAIAKRLIKIDTATLVNLVSDTRTVPEFLQERCRPELIAEGVLDLLRESSPGRAAQIAAAETTMARLGQGADKPSVRAARSVLAALARKHATMRAS